MRQECRERFPYHTFKGNSNPGMHHGTCVTAIRNEAYPNQQMTNTTILSLGCVTPSDSFTVPLRSPDDQHLPAITWPIINWSTRQSQFIFKPTNHKIVLPANWRSCLIPHGQSYCHQARTELWNAATTTWCVMSEQNAFYWDRMNSV